MSGSVFNPIHVNESENGENQWRNGDFRTKDSQRYTAGQSAVFHRAQKNEKINLVLFFV